MHCNFNEVLMVL